MSDSTRSDPTTSDSTETVTPRNPRQPQIVGYADFDGDGYSESALVDTDGDGIDDTIVQDFTGDGIVDTIAYDVDGDGFSETSASDLDQDGTVDTYFTDVDEDGVRDIAVSDLDQNGIPDGFSILCHHPQPSSGSRTFTHRTIGCRQRPDALRWRWPTPMADSLRKELPPMSNQWWLAIDFGTSNTAAAAYEPGSGAPSVVPLSHNSDIMSSSVYADSYRNVRGR